MPLDANELNCFRQLAREILHKELRPVVERHEAEESFPMAAFQAFARSGLPFLHFPEEWGGANSLKGLTAVAEEMARVDPGFGLSVLASSQLFGYNVLRLGTPEQKNKYLPAVVGGKLGCWALTEPEAGSDAVGIKTRATLSGDHYTLQGSKTFITNAPIADFFIVLARESGEGIEGGTAFILEKGQRGMELGKPLKKLGNRTSPTGEIFLHDCRVPKSQVLGQPGKAFFDMKHSLDIERVVFMGLALGMMKECLARVVVYCQGRKQFGAPIASYQLVQEKIAEMAARTEMLEAYGEKLFRLLDAGQSVNYEAGVVKYLGADWCVEVADRAVQLLGGNGYMREYFVEKLLRDARLFPIGGGTSEMNKLIIAKHALKRSFT